MIGSARIVGPYRYRLDRSWKSETIPRRVVWIMLNPSTADAQTNDPTIRRCMAFSHAWGCSDLTVVNLFALRATDPSELRHSTDPIGPENDEAIVMASTQPLASLVVAAWGEGGKLYGRGAVVQQLLRASGIALHHLGLTKHGRPKHPLYLKATTEPAVW